MSLVLVQFLSFGSIPNRSYEHLSDNELIGRCCEKSVEWQEIWREFERRFEETILFNICSAFKAISQEARFSNGIVKNLREDVYIALLKDNARALRNFRRDNEYSFLAYLYAISNKLVKHFVRNGGHTRVIAQPKISIGVTELEFMAFQKHIIEKMKANYQSRNLDRDILIFRLFYFEGQKARDIARNKNINLTFSGVETIVRRIIRRLTESLKK